MSNLSLSIAIFFSIFFSTRLFATNLLIEGFYPTQASNQVQQPKQVYDYTILNNKNINHTLDDIEEVEDESEDNVLAVNRKLITTNNQSTPLILGAVLQHQRNNEHHQYLIANTGLLSKTTQPRAVKRAHKKRFHLIKATRGHVGLQLLEWLQISEHYNVIALHTNRPVCRNCYLIAHSLWKKKLQINEKGCFGLPFPVLDEVPNLARQYINIHFHLPFVQKFLIPMMGYITKEESQKAIQQKDKEMTSLIASMEATLSNEVKIKDKQLDEKDDHIQMLNQEITKKDNQLNDKNKTISSLTSVIKDKEQIIAELQYILQNMPKKTLDDEAKKKLFYAIRKNEVGEVETFLLTYKDVVTAIQYRRTLFLYAAEEGRLKIAKLLREQGANINATGYWGRNALHLACLSGSIEMVTWLLDVCKLGIETTGKYQKTPFIFAAQRGWLKIAKLLKKRGANINAKDGNGNNALYWAKNFSPNKEMINYLQSLGLG